jgi:hypothetical protein
MHIIRRFSYPEQEHCVRREMTNKKSELPLKNQLQSTHTTPFSNFEITTVATITRFSLDWTLFAVTFTVGRSSSIGTRYITN